MIIEIGTSDFRTSAGNIDGVFIEPIKYYFDRLPKCNKENVAISNYEGSVDAYYITDREIELYKLPDWLRGCSTIKNIHPTLKRNLEKRNIPLSIVKTEKVRVVRIKSIIEKYNIEYLDLLKVDTEGHDAVILNDYLDTVSFLPKVIIFESNGLVHKSDVKSLIERLTSLNYEISKSKTDVICEIKNKQ